MNIVEIRKLLENSGIRVLNADSLSVYIEDPSCVIRGFETFVKYAWVVITIITAFLLFGWAISMIRGAKNDIVTNLRNLFLIFVTLSMAGPIINMIYGDDIFSIGCKTINIPIHELKDLQNRKLNTIPNNQLNTLPDTREPNPTNKPNDNDDRYYHLGETGGIIPISSSDY